MKVKKITSTGCGDWYLGWGYGGHNKCGRLKVTNDPNVFEWRGSCNGRHGQVWWTGGYAKITVNEAGEIEISDVKKGHPVLSEIRKAINILTNKN